MACPLCPCTVCYCDARQAQPGRQGRSLHLFLVPGSVWLESWTSREGGQSPVGHFSSPQHGDGEEEICWLVWPGRGARWQVAGAGATDCLTELSERGAASSRNAIMQGALGLEWCTSKTNLLVPATFQGCRRSADSLYLHPAPLTASWRRPLNWNRTGTGIGAARLGIWSVDFRISPFSFFARRSYRLRFVLIGRPFPHGR